MGASPIPHSSPYFALTVVVLLQVIVRRTLPRGWFYDGSGLLLIYCPDQSHSGNICYLHTLYSFTIKFQDLSISYTVKVLPGDILFRAVGVQKCIILNAIPVDKTITISSCCLVGSILWHPMHCNPSDSSIHEIS